MNYPTNLLRAFAVVCSWRILGVKIMNILKANKMSNDILLTRGDSVYLAVRSKVIVYPDNYTVVWLSLASRYYKVL